MMFVKKIFQKSQYPGRLEVLEFFNFQKAMSDEYSRFTVVPEIKEEQSRRESGKAPRRQAALLEVAI